MSGRTIIALLLAPIVAGTAYASWVLSSLAGIPESHRPDPWTQFVPGVLGAVVFELFVLLPLLYLLQRIHRSNRLLFICLGTTGWFLASLALLSLARFHWSDLLATSLIFLIPGFALVLVFGVIARHDAKAEPLAQPDALPAGRALEHSRAPALPARRLAWFVRCP
jgi:hypothetical protein